jgi:hypothetical protein
MNDSQSQMRIADALERIAYTLEVLATSGEQAEECPHPDEECEPTVNSTMQRVIMRCKACGAEGI